MGDRFKRVNSTTSVALIVLAIEFSVATCQESISLTQDRNSLCTSIVLICSFDNLHFVRFEEFVTEGFGFSTLTTNYISSNPDYEEVVSDGLYKLRITRAERYNGTRYRCHGFVGDLSEAFHSDEWQLVVPPEDICATLAMNAAATTVPAVQDTKSTITVSLNSTMMTPPAGSEEEAHLPGLERLPTWAAALFSLIAVPVVVLIVVPLCVVVACARRKGKTGNAALYAISNVNSLPVSVQADGDVTNSSDLPVMTEMRVDRFSTPVTARFSECSLDLEIEPWPCDGNLMLPHPKGTKANDTMCQASASFPEVSDGVAEARVGVPRDMSNEALQTPQVASTDHAAGAIQVAGTVMMYDNVRLERNRTLLQIAVEQHTAVSCSDEVPTLLIPSRSGYGIDGEDVSMFCNPAYVAIEFSHQTADVPMQDNPAYEALETTIQSSHALGQVQQLQPSAGTELSK